MEEYLGKKIKQNRVRIITEASITTTDQNSESEISVYVCTRYIHTRSLYELQPKSKGRHTKTKCLPTVPHHLCCIAYKKCEQQSITPNFVESGFWPISAPHKAYQPFTRPFRHSSRAPCSPLKNPNNTPRADESNQVVMEPVR